MGTVSPMPGESVINAVQRLREDKKAEVNSEVKWNGVEWSGVGLGAGGLRPRYYRYGNVGAFLVAGSDAVLLYQGRRSVCVLRRMKRSIFLEKNCMLDYF